MERVVYMNASTGAKIEVRREDVTTVGEALAGCDAALMLECVLAMEAGPRYSADALPDPARYSLTRLVAGYLDRVVRCREGSCLPGAGPLSGTVAPFEWYEVDDASGGIRHRLGVAVLDTCFAGEAQRVLSCTGGYAYELAEVHAAERMVPDSATVAPWAWPGMRISAYRLVSAAWEEAVQTPIWLPAEFDSRERHFVLARVLWMMTQEGLGGLSAIVSPSADCPADQAQRSSGASPLLLQPDGSIPLEQLFIAKSSDVGSLGQGACGEAYSQRLCNIVKLLNYNCWIDATETCAALAALDA